MASCAWLCDCYFWSGALTFGYPGVLSEYWRQTLHSDAGMVMTLLLVSAGIGTFYVVNGICC